MRVLRFDKVFRTVTVTAIRVATQALLRNRLRTVLTALGISIGIASVMATVALGAGGTAAIEAQLAALGEDFVWIRPGSANTGGVRGGAGSRRSLTVQDALAIAPAVPEIEECSPIVNGREQMIADGRNWNTRFIGVSPEYFRIRQWIVDRGAELGPYDVESRGKAAILGATVATELYGDTDPVGSTVRLGAFPFTVIGVLRARGSDRSGINQDDVVVMPYTTAQRSIEGESWIDEIICSTTSAEATVVAEARVTNLLRLRHNLGPGDEDDFNLRRPQDILNVRLSSAETLGFMLAAVALVSLLVGGIGIMNIMLVSVAERTREIGLRLALGARQRDIRFQFMVEALMLGAVGAAIGILLGFGASRVLTTWLGWETIVSLEAVAAAVVFAVAAGFIFGYVPARRASDLTPIDALRNE
jgi:putative ABC transport system permease protein